MRPRLLLTINWKFAVDFFARGLHTRTAVTRLPLRQLGFLVSAVPNVHQVLLSQNITFTSYDHTHLEMISKLKINQWNKILLIYHPITKLTSDMDYG